MAVTYKARYGQPAAACTITAVEQPGQAASSDGPSQRSSEFASSAYWQPIRQHAEDAGAACNVVRVGLPDPARAITPQQEFVMYDGEVRRRRLASMLTCGKAY